MNTSKIPENITKLREECGYTQEELAGIIGRTNQTISNWENGKTEISFNDAEKLCNAFNCDIMHLLGQDKHKTKEERIAGKYLGLSPASTQYLHSIRHRIDSDTLDYLLTNHSEEFSNFLFTFYHCILCFDLSTSSKEELETDDDYKHFRKQEDFKIESKADILETLHILQSIRDNIKSEIFYDNIHDHDIQFRKTINDKAYVSDENKGRETKISYLPI